MNSEWKNANTTIRIASDEAYRRALSSVRGPRPFVGSNYWQINCDNEVPGRRTGRRIKAALYRIIVFVAMVRVPCCEQAAPNFASLRSIYWADTFTYLWLFGFRSCFSFRGFHFACSWQTRMQKRSTLEEAVYVTKEKRHRNSW